jgi:integrase
MSLAGTITLSTAVEQYLATRRGRHSEVTTKQDAIIMRRLVSIVGNLQVRHLRAEHIEKFFTDLTVEHQTRDGRTRPPVSNATFNMYRSRIRMLAQFLQQRGHTRDDLMAHVQPLKRERRIRQQATPDMLWAMLDSAKDPRDRGILATAMNTGLRSSEIAALKVADVDLETMTLRVRISKTHQEDDLPVTSDLGVELAEWMKHYRSRGMADLNRVLQPSDFLFPRRTGPRYAWRTLPNGTKEQFQRPGEYDPLRPAARLHTVAQDALRAVGLPTRHEGIHTVRRSVARTFYDLLVTREGYDGAIRTVSAFLHHSSSAQTEHYLGVSSEVRKRDVALRGRSLLGPRPALKRAGVA